MSKKKRLRQNLYVRIALAAEEFEGLVLSADDVQELYGFQVSGGISSMAVVAAAKEGYGIDDIEGLVKIERSRADALLGKEPRVRKPK